MRTIDDVARWRDLFPEITEDDEYERLVREACDLWLDQDRTHDHDAHDAETGTARTDRPVRDNPERDNPERDLADEAVPDVDHVHLGAYFLHEVAPIVERFRAEIARVAVLSSSHDVVAVAVVAVAQMCAALGVRTVVAELHRQRDAGLLEGETSEDRYADFVRRISSPDGRADLRQRYPVLARTLQERTQRHLEFVVEVLRHTEGHLAELAATFPDVVGEGLVASVSTNNGDTHRDGRSVAILTFESGARLVYKPRSMTIEGAFNTLVRALRDRAGIDLRTIRTLSATEFGWAEFVEHSEHVPDRRRYYEEVGSLTGILYLLNGWDIHHENLLTVEGRPVVVDLETLLRPQFRATPGYADGSAAQIAVTQLETSVCTIGILPMVIKRAHEDVGIDVGGVGFRRGQASPFKGFALVDVGRDDMRISFDTQVAGTGNENAQDDEAETAIADRTSIQVGFRRLFDWVLGHKDELGELLGATFAHVRARYVHNPTMFYSQLLRMGTHPDFMVRDEDLWVLMHRVGLRRQDLGEGIARSEVVDLCNGDVPYFQYDADGRRLLDSRDAPTGPAFRRSPLGSVLAKLDALTEQDVAEQLRLVAMTFVHRLPRSGDPTGFSFPAAGAPPVDVPRGRMLAEARRLGDRLEETMVESSSGIQPSTWLAPLVTTSDHSQWVPGTLGYDLYGGVPGIGLYLAALAAETGEERTSAAARSVLARLSAQLRPGVMDSSMITLGGMTGLAGAFHATAVGGRLLGSADMVDATYDALPLLVDAIDRDPSFDFMAGSAGALATCLSLYRSATTPEQRGTSLDHAVRAYERIAQASPHVLGGDGPAAGIYSGFGHGLAGMVPFVAELGAVTGDARVRATADRLLERLLSMRDPHDGTWRRSTVSDAESFAWCHGSTGILLGLLLAAPHLDHGSLDAVVRELVDLTVERSFGHNVTYCHGDLANLEVLGLAADRLGDADLADRVTAGFVGLFDTVLERYGESSPSKYAASTSLMVGTSGIGYAILRHVSAVRPPSVLWLE
ncbi:type 2 lanthipeptide synthetase LanM [Sanguibacter sp. 25GB23B1]|uniref:type 2 lanthipeptide synthetase LanM n=1 Tax=unclassified Sanguibacter TaxID=2645534 RepID=UPI0032AFEFA5